jgi:WD40 repeat protein
MLMSDQLPLPPPVDGPSLSSQPGAVAASAPPNVPDHDLLRVIGQGAYGEVWLARNRTTGVFRAVKVVRRQNFLHARPFERELRGLQTFEPVSRGHEGLVDILHVGENEAEGYFYYVMELADDCGADGGLKMEDGKAGPGAVVQVPSASFDPLTYRPKTLSAVLAQRGRLSLDECMKLGLTVSGGLEFMHARGLVHRDVKPANIIYVVGVPKLADIGLVTQVDATVSEVGTRGYVPLHGAGQPAGDLFALGKVLYEAATGKAATLYPEPATEVTTLPEQTALAELNQVVLRACEELPKERYQRADELRGDLLLLQSGRSLVKVRKNERYVAVAKKSAVGVTALFVLVLAGFGYSQQRTSAELTVQRRERALQSAVLARLAKHCSGWSSNTLYFSQVASASTDDPQHRSVVQSHAAAALLGLDAVTTADVTIKDAGCIAVHPSGRSFLVGGQRSVTLWTNPAQPPQLLLVQGACALAYRADEVPLALVVPAVEDDLFLMRPDTGQRLAALDGLAGRLNGEKDASIAAVTFSPDASLVAVAVVLKRGASFVGVWRTDTGNLVFSSNQVVSALAVAPGNALLALGSADGRVAVLEMASGNPVASLRTDRTAVLGLTFQHHAQRHEEAGLGPNFLLAAGTAGSSVFIWDLSTNDRLARCLGSQMNVNRLVFSSDGTLLFTGGRLFIKVWDTTVGGLVLTIPALSFVYDFALAPDESRLLLTGNEWGPNHLQEIELSAGRGTRTLRGLSTPVIKTFLSPDGHWLAGISQAWELGVWEWPSGRLHHVFEAPKGRSADNSAVAFSADGFWLAAAAGKAAKLWDLRTGAKGRDWTLPDGLVDVLTWPANGSLVSFRVEAEDGVSRFATLSFGQTNPIVCHIRDLLSPVWTNPVATLTDFNSSVYHAEASDAGRMFVVEGDQVSGDHANRSVKFVEALSGRVVRTIPTATTLKLSSSGLRADPAGRWVTFGTNDASATVLVEARTGEPGGVLERAPLSFSSDRAYAAMAGVLYRDEQGKLTNSAEGLTVTSLATLLPLVGFPADGSVGGGHPCFDPAGQWLFWGNDDGTVSAANIEGVRQELDKVGLGW